jgi:hypothetical protein
MCVRALTRSQLHRWALWLDRLSEAPLPSTPPGDGVRTLSSLSERFAEADDYMRAGFYINLPIGGVAAVLIFLIPIAELTLKPPFSFAHVRKVIPDLDLTGFTLFVPSSILLLLAMQFGSGNTYAWSSSTVIGLFCGSGVSIILFITWEWRMGDRAMLPGTLLNQRIVWTSCLYGSCIISCLVTASNWLPTYFQAVRGDGPTLSGVHVLPSILSQLLVVIVVGAAGKSSDIRSIV